MRTFRLLALRRLRLAPGRAATTVLAIAAGVSLAVSISVLLTSIDRSLDDFGRQIAGPAPLRITGATVRGGLPEDAVARAQAVDGVAAVVPMIQTAGRVQANPGGDLDPVLVLGADCRIEALTGPFGCDPNALAAAIGAIAIGPGQQVGGDTVLRTDLGRLPLAGAPTVQGLAAGGGRAVLLPLPVAQAQYTRPGQVDTAYVLLDPGADLATVRRELQAAVGDHLPVLGGTEPPAGAGSVLGAALPIYALLGIFALGIGAVLVSNVAAMSVEARRRDLAMLGALGARRRTIVSSLLGELALLGVAGGLLGSVAGPVVPRPIIGSLSTFTSRAAGITLRTHLGPSSVLTGVVLGGLLGAGAALPAALRASRLDIAGELAGRAAGDRAGPTHLGRRLVLWGLVLAAGALGCWAAPRDGGLEPWQSAIYAPAFLAMTLGTLFAAAAGAPLLVARLADLTTSSRSPALRIGLAAARRDHRRTGMLAVTVSAAVVTAFVTEGSSASARASIEQSFRRAGAGVDVATVPPRSGNGANVPPALLESVTTVPGVDRVVVGSFVLAGAAADLTLVQAADGTDFTFDVVDGTADVAGLDAGSVMIGTGLARREQVRSGDEVELATPQGIVTLPIQGVWEDGNNVGVNVMMSAGRLAELYGPQPPGFVSARPAPGVSEAELEANLAAAVLDPELRTRRSTEVADDIADDVDNQFASFRVMQQALLAVLFVAVLSSLLLAGVHRRRELGLLAAVGAAPTGLSRLLLAEAAVVGIVGLASSLVVGPVMAWGLNRILPFVVGFVNPLVLAWGALAQAGLVALLVAVAGAWWPARRAACVEVQEALRYE